MIKQWNYSTQFGLVETSVDTFYPFNMISNLKEGNQGQ